MPKLKNKIATSDHILSLFMIHEAVDVLGKTGYDAIEIWAQNLEHQLKTRDTSFTKIRQALKEHSMTGVMHCPLKNLESPDRHKYNISSKDKKLRKESMDAMLRAIDYTKRLNFKVITIHPGHTDLPGQEAEGEYWKLQINAFRRLAKHAEMRGVKIGMEPMEHRPKEFVMEPKDVDRVINAVRSKNLGVTFDLIHAYSHGKDKPIEFLDGLHKNIFHVHMSGHNDKKNHVPFSMTRLRHSYLDKVLKKLSRTHAGMISIEGTTHGLVRQNKVHQRKVVKDNLEYIHRELKSLHLEQARD